MCQLYCSQAQVTGHAWSKQAVAHILDDAGEEHRLVLLVRVLHRARNWGEDCLRGEGGRGGDAVPDEDEVVVVG